MQSSSGCVQMEVDEALQAQHPEPLVPVVMSHVPHYALLHQKYSGIQHDDEGESALEGCHKAMTAQPTES